MIVSNDLFLSSLFLSSAQLVQVTVEVIKVIIDFFSAFIIVSVPEFPFGSFSIYFLFVELLILFLYCFPDFINHLAVLLQLFDDP